MLILVVEIDKMTEARAFGEASSIGAAIRILQLILERCGDDSGRGEDGKERMRMGNFALPFPKVPKVS